MWMLHQIFSLLWLRLCALDSWTWPLVLGAPKASCGSRGALVKFFGVCRPANACTNDRPLVWYSYVVVKNATASFWMQNEKQVPLIGWLKFAWPANVDIACIAEVYNCRRVRANIRQYEFNKQIDYKNKKIENYLKKFHSRALPFRHSQ